MSDIYLSLTETPTVVTLSQPVVSGVLSSNVTVTNVVSVNVVTMPAINVTAAAPTVTTVAGTVTANVPLVDATLSGGVTQAVPVYLAGGKDGVVIDEINYINNIPAISGTVTANLSSANLNSVTIGVRGVVTSGISDISIDARNQLADSIALYAEDNRGFPIRVAGADGGDVPVIGDVGVSGTVTANVGGIASGVTIPVRLFAEKEGEASSGQDTLVLCDAAGQLLVNAKSGGASVLGYDGNAFVSVKQVAGSSVTIGSLPAISGTVTANNPNGSLTTRFGSVTTANTAQISAVTNTSRKYLLAQNISAGTVTIGIGFSPTTTQGIQLTAGAGLTFDSFCPTGAVYWLGAVTGAAFTILEG